MIFRIDNVHIKSLFTLCQMAKRKDEEEEKSHEKVTNQF